MNSRPISVWRHNEDGPISFCEIVRNPTQNSERTKIFYKGTWLRCLGLWNTWAFLKKKE